MKIKPGANYDDLTPEMKQACDDIEPIFNDEDYILVLTSGRDGVHGPTTRHDIGEAGDFRTRHILRPALMRIVARVKGKLGKDFDVILESDHLHIEHDPKG